MSKITDTPLKQAINSFYRSEEKQVIEALLVQCGTLASGRSDVQQLAQQLTQATRDNLEKHNNGVEALLQEYDLSSEEGVLLMCLAEALIRIPDSTTQERLIRDKLMRGRWDEHLGHSPSLFVNASSWGLFLTGKLVSLGAISDNSIGTFLQRLLARGGEKLVRLALSEAMQILAHSFVFGATIDAALKRTNKDGSRYSFDCLGEAALTLSDAERYFSAYRHAIDAISQHYTDSQKGIDAPGLSIKLSALHPRYEPSQHERITKELIPRVRELVLAAIDKGITVTIDAEEAYRLDLSLVVFEALVGDAQIAQPGRLGLAVQAYQKRALPLLRWLADLGKRYHQRIPVRLVKGAYWDSEIKRAQLLGLDGYPVFTHKAATDVSYLACAQYILSHKQEFYGQFASHNSHTVASIMHLARHYGYDWEFQRLHGMGAELYESLYRLHASAPPCRIYAPIGSHEELLPYLVRRLLENGANSSFINQLTDPKRSIEQLIRDPIIALSTTTESAQPQIPLPRDLFRPHRENSHGIDFSDNAQWSALQQQINVVLQAEHTAHAMIAGKPTHDHEHTVTEPRDNRHVAGIVYEADTSLVAQAYTSAQGASRDWSNTAIETRIEIVLRTANALQANQAELIALCVREAGRSIIDAQAEVREAIDFCRYYAEQARDLFATDQTLTGPTGEDNRLSLHGRGVFACISPWNFPIAIFTGQIVAALLAGNAVLAKPARQTPLCAARIIHYLHCSGIPTEVLHFLPGSSSQLGTALVQHPALTGIVFTGSFDTAKHLQRALAQRPGAILPLIAETGGQNAMIVDSSALQEQVIIDVMQSAFNSAGQRCSALRVLFLQDTIADNLLERLIGAMDQLSVGDPALLSTDMGPLIDRCAQQTMQAHVQLMDSSARKVHSLNLDTELEHGCFFAPHVYEIKSPQQLQGEIFGPILHVIRYQANKLDKVIESINQSGYGLTLGLHSRIEATWEQLRRQAKVGNLYINRNMIGAAVGVQPFGGEGLSGTGPKAGGPNYLMRFTTERSLAINSAAVGGNFDILSLNNDE